MTAKCIEIDMLNRDEPEPQGGERSGLQWLGQVNRAEAQNRPAAPRARCRAVLNKGFFGKPEMKSKDQKREDGSCWGQSCTPGWGWPEFQYPTSTRWYPQPLVGGYLPLPPPLLACLWAWRGDQTIAPA